MNPNELKTYHLYFRCDKCEQFFTIDKHYYTRKPEFWKIRSMTLKVLKESGNAGMMCEKCGIKLVASSFEQWIRFG